jgi:hypothetical protein
MDPACSISPATVCNQTKDEDNIDGKRVAMDVDNIA